MTTAALIDAALLELDAVQPRKDIVRDALEAARERLTALEVKCDLMAASLRKQDKRLRELDPDWSP